MVQNLLAPINRRKLLVSLSAFFFVIIIGRKK